MEERTNYGKIIAITLAIITAASAISFVIYKLVRRLIAFCNVYDNPEEQDDIADFDEIDEAPEVQEELFAEEEKEA